MRRSRLPRTSCRRPSRSRAASEACSPCARAGWRGRRWSSSQAARPSRHSRGRWPRPGTAPRCPCCSAQPPAARRLARRQSLALRRAAGCSWSARASMAAPACSLVEPAPRQGRARACSPPRPRTVPRRGPERARRSRTGGQLWQGSPPSRPSPTRRARPPSRATAWPLAPTPARPGPPWAPSRPCSCPRPWARPCPRCSRGAGSRLRTAARAWWTRTRRRRRMPLAPMTVSPARCWAPVRPSTRRPRAPRVCACACAPTPSAEGARRTREPRSASATASRSPSLRTRPRRLASGSGMRQLERVRRRSFARS
mmetsp:Transcript_20756/g.69622  ORF Transcript_20756/g.69622 Transcript_20756/m.69622 type:complete len:312 (+) Transcript_20756:2064-2999(+)